MVLGLFLKKTSTKFLRALMPTSSPFRRRSAKKGKLTLRQSCTHSILIMQCVKVILVRRFLRSRSRCRCFGICGMKKIGPVTKTLTQLTMKDACLLWNLRIFDLYVYTLRMPKMSLHELSHV